MANPKKSSSTKVYQTIGNHIDQNLTERLNEGVSEKGNNTIERIRGELFDVLTIGGDENSRKEIGKNIKSELEKQLSKKEGAIKEKRKQGEIPSYREKREIIILNRLIKDVDYRLGHGISTPDVNNLNRNVYLDLDKNDNFDKDVIKDVVEDIINSDIDDIKKNVLLKRLIKSDKYYEEICKELRTYGKKLYKGLFIEDILDYLKSVKDKDSDSFEKKLLDFKVNGGKALRLRERNDIRQRFNSLEPGDRILLNDGTTIIVISKSKYGNKITFREDRGDYGTQEITENFNDFSDYRCKLGDIKEIIIFKDSTKPNPKPDPKPNPKPNPKPDPKPNPKPDPKPDPKPNPKPDPTPDPDPDPKPDHKKPYIAPKITIKDDPDLPTVFEENAVLSDVSESYEDMISRMVENEINEEWHNTSKFNVFKRGKLFLMRGRIRKKKIEEMKKNYERTPFTNNGLINREMSTQATRHDLEEVLGKKGVKRDAFGKIDRKNMIAANEVSGDPLHETARGKEFREMCQDYVAGTISQIEFQNRFNKFVHDKLGLPKEQQFVATNVLEKLDAIKNDNKLLKDITKELEDYLKPNDHKASHFDAIRKKIDDDFKKYKRDPRFRAEILNIIGNTAGLTKEQLDEKINKFIRHQRALAKMSTKNLQIKLDLLTNGKGAYQTNNKDRENWLFRFGNKLDKMPRWGQALTVAGISASGIIVGAATGSALAATLTLSGLVGAKNAIKKYTHHTKEQNTYEKNLTRNYEEEIAKMKERERIRDEKDSEGKYTHGRFSRYRAKRQLELYGKTTQTELQNENTGNTKELSDFIYASLERYNSLNPDEKNALNCTLLDAKARLETYWAKGHNFLKSKDKNQIERDFYDLENALNLSASRILGAGASLKEISQINAYDASGKAVNYNDLLDLYKKDYNSASKKFRGERAWLATKWGIGTAAITFGTSAAIQAISGTGMFAKDAVAGTPGTPNSTSTTNTGTVMDNYGMGKYELSGGNKIFQAAQDNISGLNSTDTVTLHLGSGTDGTAVRAGSSLLNHSTYLDKLDQVKDVIANSSLSNKADLIRQVNSGFSTSGFTNTDLHGMRCLEAIEETVKGAGNFTGNLNISYDTALNIDGAVAHDAASRMSQAFLEISQFVPGEPGREAVKGGAKWLILGLPRFSNTFKRNNDGKPEQKPVTPVVNEGDDKPNDKPNDKGDNMGKDKGGASAIIVPPMKSDETQGTKEKNDEKEEVTEELKNNVKKDLNKLFHEDSIDENKYKEKYDGSSRALKKLEEAKTFWKNFPKVNFYDENEVNSLNEKYKDNAYILGRIDKEMNSGLNSEFKHHLSKSEIKKYEDKAKSLINSALSDGNYAKYGIRPMIIVKISDELTIPFYISTGTGNKNGVPEGKFYPIFGIGSDGRLNKGLESEINNYYGSPLLAAIAKELDNRYENKKINISERGNSNQKFEDNANIGKNPVTHSKGGYDNINEVLKKVSEIKDSE